MPDIPAGLEAFFDRLDQTSPAADDVLVPETDFGERVLDPAGDFIKTVAVERLAKSSSTLNADDYEKFLGSEFGELRNDAKLTKRAVYEDRDDWLEQVTIPQVEITVPQVELSKSVPPVKRDTVVEPSPEIAKWRREMMAKSADELNDFSDIERDAEIGRAKLKEEWGDPEDHDESV
jgi:hypothetical protein